MLNNLFDNILSDGITTASFFLCTAASLLLGLLLAAAHLYKNRHSASLVTALALLPLIVQVVMMLVNGNLGTGVAVMGAFSLVRFRSAPGNAREIVSIFTAMAVGLATGVGYIGIAAVFTLLVIGLNLLYASIRFGEPGTARRKLKIVIPESLDYTAVFDEPLAQYTTRHELLQVKTTNMGSLYHLTYDIDLKKPENEKAFLDELRCRNGNLDIICSRAGDGMEL